MIRITPKDIIRQVHAHLRQENIEHDVQELLAEWIRAGGDVRAARRMAQEYANDQRFFRALLASIVKDVTRQRIEKLTLLDELRGVEVLAINGHPTTTFKVPSAEEIQEAGGSDHAKITITTIMDGTEIATHWTFTVTECLAAHLTKGHWIVSRKGESSLHIETFTLRRWRKSN
jgi:hypothetical protein